MRPGYLSPPMYYGSVVLPMRTRKVFLKSTQVGFEWVPYGKESVACIGIIFERLLCSCPHFSRYRIRFYIIIYTLIICFLEGDPAANHYDQNIKIPLVQNIILTICSLGRFLDPTANILLRLSQYPSNSKQAFPEILRSSDRNLIAIIITSGRTKIATAPRHSIVECNHLTLNYPVHPYHDSCSPDSRANPPVHFHLSI